MKKNENITILITGATGGLGQEFCKQFLQNNNHLIITSTSLEKASNLKADLLARNNSVKITAIKCDFLEESDINNLAEYIETNNIQLDYLVNNAGYITEGTIKNASEETILNCIKVNCLGTIKLTKKVLDLHEISTRLRIITITSLAGDYPMPYMAIYSSTKSLLKNFMLSLGHEFKKENVSSLVVQPGAIPTSKEMKDAISAQGFKGKLSSTPPEIIVKKSIKKSIRRKKIYTPGVFNKLTKFISYFAPVSLKMSAVSSMWKKSQQKRNIK